MAREGHLLGAVPRALLALALGFALLGLPPVGAAFDGVALALAALAEAALGALGVGVARTGTLLRETGAAGWGMDVTRVCDGHGLVIGLGALLAGLAPGWRRGLWLLAGGVAAIQAFNLGRILVLAGVLSARPAAFEAVHLGAFPLLTAGLMLLAAPLARPGLGGATAVALGALLLLSAAWLLGADRLAGAALVPPANLLSALGGGAPVAPRPDAWVVETTLIAAREPLAFHRVAIHPADFAVGWPPLLAAALAAGRRAWAGAALGFALSAVALALGAATSTWLLEAAERAVPAEGGFAARPWAPPGAAVQGAARLAQNVLVHLNLLVLPGLLLARARPQPRARA